MADLSIRTEKQILLDKRGNANITRSYILRANRTVHFDTEYIDITETSINLCDYIATGSGDRKLPRTCEQSSGKSVIKFWPDTLIEAGQTYRIDVNYLIPSYVVEFNKLSAWVFKDSFHVDGYDWPFSVDSVVQFAVSMAIPEFRKWWERLYKRLYIEAPTITKVDKNKIEWRFGLGAGERGKELYALYQIKAREKLVALASVVFTAIVIGLIKIGFDYWSQSITIKP